jgi:hypothetical protein
MSFLIVTDPIFWKTCRDPAYLKFSLSYYCSNIPAIAELSRFVNVNIQHEFSTKNLFQISRTFKALCTCGVLYLDQNEFCSHLHSCKFRHRFNVTRESEVINVEN